MSVTNVFYRHKVDYKESYCMFFLFVNVLYVSNMNRYKYTYICTYIHVCIYGKSMLKMLIKLLTVSREQTF